VSPKFGLVESPASVEENGICRKYVMIANAVVKLGELWLHLAARYAASPQAPWQTTTLLKGGGTADMPE
jgi:hypothetical protein